MTQRMNYAEPSPALLTKSIELTPCEKTFADALVDQLFQAAKGGRSQAEVSHYVYIDSTLGGSCDQRDQRSLQNGGKTVRPNARSQLDPSSTALTRVGIAATNVYCLKVFGRQFADISNVDQNSVLSVLDSIKSVFQDGSHAGVFFAAVTRRL